MQALEDLTLNASERTWLRRLRESTGLELEVASLESNYLFPPDLCRRCQENPLRPAFLDDSESLHYGVGLSRVFGLMGSTTGLDHTAREHVRRLFRLGVSNAHHEDDVHSTEIELESFATHVSLVYEQISATGELPRLLDLSRDVNDVIESVTELVTDVLDVEQTLFLGPTDEGQQSRLRSSPDLDPSLIEYLAATDEDVVVIGSSKFPARTMMPCLATRIRPSCKCRSPKTQPADDSQAMHADCWLVAVPRSRDHELGTEEAQFMLTVSRMLEAHLCNVALYREQEEMSVAFVQSMISTLDARDHYTQGHSLRVAEVARELARLMGTGATDLEEIYVSGLLHDLGKIGISDDVLRKPGKLTDDEWTEIRRHPVIGFDILAGVPQLKGILPGVRSHHESLDGSGYPDGLQADQIPFMARVLAVADAFDAMASDRPYRAGIPDDRVDAILADGAGTQWDPEIVKTFLAHRESIRKHWREQFAASRPRLGSDREPKRTA